MTPLETNGQQYCCPGLTSQRQAFSDHVGGSNHMNHSEIERLLDKFDKFAQEIRAENQKLETRLSTIMGGIGAITVLISLFAPAIRNVLGLE